MASTGLPLTIPIPIDGQRIDVDAKELPRSAAAKLRNWIVRQGKFQVRPGFTVIGDNKTQRPTGFIYYPHNDGVMRLVMGTVGGWYLYVSGTDTWTDLTETANELTGSAANLQVFRVFNTGGVNLLVGCNGKDNPKGWNGADTTPYADLTGAPICGCMAVAFSRLIVGNLSTDPLAVDCSSFLNPNAGWGGINITKLADTPGPIIGMLEMGNQETAIYKSDAVYRAIAQGSLYPFSYELAKANIKGPMSSATLLPLDDALHCWLADDFSIQQFDGVTVALLSNAAQEHIKQTINPDRKTRAFGFYDSIRGEMWWLYPSVGAAEPCIGVMLSRNTSNVWPITFRTLRPTASAKVSIPSGITWTDLKAAGTTWSQLGTTTWGDMSSTSSAVILGDVGGQAYMESGNDDNGDPIDADWETGQIDLTEDADGQRDSRRYSTADLVDCLFVPTDAVQEIDVTVAITDDGSDVDFTGGQSDTIDISETGPFLAQFRTTGRMCAIKVKTEATEPIQCRGLMVIGKPRGLR